MSGVGPVDLRSDTVTRPCDDMRRAMASAEVGDDVFGEDPTVRRLQELAAELTGTEAALFVPSGTMGNQVALSLHAQPGAELICAQDSHVVLYEMGAMAVLSGLIPRLVVAEGGLLEAGDLAASIPPEAPYRSRTRLLVVENTFNMSGGRVYDRARLDSVLAVADDRGLRKHLDGARVFNAAAALGVPVAELCRGFDSVNFCLSKGLGAPVGSLLCGDEGFIAEAWRIRKMLGGGMRQVGVIAAAGLVALEKGPAQLEADHANARHLADGLAGIPGLHVDPETVETNILVFRVDGSFGDGSLEEPGDAADLVARLGERGILAIPVASDAVRLVTHRDVDRADCDRALEVLRELGALPQSAK
ncbi:MAG: beta-eliminating lyase-related protein [Thermoanaerobaculia bacterium]|nr:beta-eliminating lyase-related protein [Thermoanaerobaculia bacterium]